MSSRVDAGSAQITVQEAISSDDFRIVLARYFSQERGMAILQYVMEGKTLLECRLRAGTAILQETKPAPAIPTPKPFDHAA